ncbi:E2 domain-containing protein [Rhizobium ruizarguesonis]
MPLSDILDACPNWFQISSSSEEEILGSARVEVEGAADTISVDLRVHDQWGAIAVQEQIPGTKYPKTCHERHLQSDEHFCLGMRAGSNIVSKDHAVVWWGLLKHFLELQRVAQRTRRWPPQQQMSHGDGGPHQVAAVSAARDLGIEEAYMRMLEGEESWFSVGAFKINKRGKLTNGWLPCPAGCRNNGKPVSRERCCNPGAVATLLNEERLRRKKVADFYAYSRGRGEMCCGTMLSCGLRGFLSDIGAFPAQVKA